MNARLRIALTTCAFSVAATIAQADTIYVDQRFGPGGNGTAAAPYNTIQAAIDNANSVLIVVYPGTYAERLTVTKSLTILGYDGPLTTRINAVAGGNAVTMAQNIIVTLQGLTISSGEYGVYQPTAGTLYLRNCILCGNISHGIYLDCTSNLSFPTVYLENCISVANGGSGLFVFVYDYYAGGGWHYSYSAALRAFNNIFIGNQRYGIEANLENLGNAGNAGGTLVFDYNDYVGNILGNYSPLFGPGMPVSAGAHSFSVAPDFVGGAEYVCNQDYRLVPTSSCRNAGQPGLGWLNPDGTRNDIGAYGGPGAATFYTKPNDGPIIRNVTIDQGMVPRGSTFTIRAKGATR